jgi:NADH-quinone oxidoreductase subunit G
VQLGLRAAFPPGDAREDWSILRALSGVLGSPLPFDSLAELRRRLYEAHPHMAEVDSVKPGAPEDVMRLRLRDGELSGPPFVSPIRDFYLTNPIARASRVLAECSALHLGPAAEAAE